MEGTNLTEEEKKDMINEVTDLAERKVLKKKHYAAILGICEAACTERISEIDAITGRPEDIVQ